MVDTVVHYERIPDYRKSDTLFPKIRVKSSPYFPDMVYYMSRLKQGSLQSVSQTYLPLHTQNLEAIVKQYIVTIEIRADGCPISEKMPVRICWDYGINCNCFA